MNKKSKKIQNNITSTKLKCNDNVIVISGRSKGKVGKIIQIKSKKNKLRAKVEGINMVYKNIKANPNKNTEAKRIQKEDFIYISNLMYWNEKSSKGVRLTYSEVDGKKRRFMKVNNNLIQIEDE